MSRNFVSKIENNDQESLIAAAQQGDATAQEQLLEQFRPLLRARLHAVWLALREQLSGLEWDDVEAEIALLFLTRLQTYRPERGVYFPHYIARMLEFDCAVWLRRQRRGEALQFSQLATVSDDSLGVWLESHHDAASDEASDLEMALSLRTALDTLSAPQREVLWECCVVGRGEEEVAAQLGLSRSAVRNRLTTALARLRAHFHIEESTDLSPRTRTGRRAKNRWAGYFEDVTTMAKDEKRPDLVGVGAGRPILFQGTFDFEATGLRTPKLISPRLRHTVLPGCVAGIRFVRAGIICDGMVCLSTVVNGAPHRLVPIAANSTMHVPFAIVEPLPAGSEIEIHIAATQPGTIILDVGCLQMPA